MKTKIVVNVPFAGVTGMQLELVLELHSRRRTAAQYVGTELACFSYFTLAEPAIRST